jgi:hypothetical protein
MTEIDAVAEIFFKKVGGCSLLAQPRDDIAIGDTFIHNGNGVYAQRHLSELVQGGYFEVPSRVTSPVAPIELEEITRGDKSTNLTFFEAILAALNVTHTALQAKLSLSGAKALRVQIKLTDVTRETTVHHAFEAAVERAKFDHKNPVVTALISDWREDDRECVGVGTYAPRVLLVCGLLKARGIYIFAEEGEQRIIDGKLEFIKLAEAGGGIAKHRTFKSKINHKKSKPLVVGVYAMELRPRRNNGFVLNPTSGPVSPLQVQVLPTNGPVPPLLQEGIVPGGGVALLYAAKALDGLTPENNNQKVGIDIVKRALQSPVRQVAENAGTEGSVVVGKLLDSNDLNLGFDAQTGEYVDMVKAGIIDPTKVVRLALQNAASVNTERMVAGSSDKKGFKTGGGGGFGGLGGM